MSKRTDREFLSDVREAIHRIKAYTVDMDFDFFLEDTKTQDAVVRNLEIIGEAAKIYRMSYAKSIQKFPGRA